MFVVWLADGLPRPLVATATGVALALVLPASSRSASSANEAGIDTVPGALWVWVEGQVAGPGPLSGTRLLALFVIALLVAAVLLPRRAGLALAGAVVAVFAVTSILAWERLIDAPEDAVFAGGLERSWIDVAVPEDARVTKLYLDTDCGSALQRHALFLRELFNETVTARRTSATPSRTGYRSTGSTSAPRRARALGGQRVGQVRLHAARAELEGERIATGTNAELVLWRTDGRSRWWCEFERRACTRLRLAHPPQVAARIKVMRNFSRSRSISNSSVCDRDVSTASSGPGMRSLRVADVRVLDDHVAADGHEPGA